MGHAGNCKATLERVEQIDQEWDLWEPPSPEIPIHPGKLLKRDYLEPHGISARQLATDLHVRPALIRGLLRGKRRVSSDLALRLGYYFDTEPRYWLGLQNA